MPGAALVFDFAADVGVDCVLGADGEGAAGLAAVAVDDGVGAQLAEQVDGVVGDGAVGEEVPQCAADVAELAGGAGVGLFPRLREDGGDRLLIHTGSLGWSPCGCMEAAVPLQRSRGRGRSSESSTENPRLQYFIMIPRL